MASRPIRIVGGRAQVYQLIDLETDDIYALKVMLPAFRKPQLLRNSSLLRQLSPHPGFEACRQVYLTPQSHAEDLAQFPDLAYSSLMPWIQGQDWKAIVGSADTVIDADTTWEIAYQFARLVRMLERNRIAHCDLSGGNVMVNLETRRVTLIDFDEVFWPQAPSPAVLPTGTPGYRRRVQSQWEPASDRFPTAIIVAEMLGWRDEKVRHISSGDSFFTDEDCLGPQSRKFEMLEQFLFNLHPDLGGLFRRAWEAPSSDQCPTADEWRTAIMRARGWRTVPLDPLDRARLDLNSLPRGSQQATPVPVLSPSTAPFPTVTQAPPGGSTNTTSSADGLHRNPLNQSPAHRVSSPSSLQPHNSNPDALGGKGSGGARQATRAEVGSEEKKVIDEVIAERRRSSRRRKIDMANVIMVAAVILTVVVLLVGMVLLVFGNR